MYPRRPSVRHAVRDRYVQRTACAVPAGSKVSFQFLRSPGQLRVYGAATSQ